MYPRPIVVHTATVRALALVVTALAVVLPAGAATVDPKALVVAPAQVPAGFRVDHDETGVRTNEREAKDFPRALFRRWRRVTGYQARYERGHALIEARVDLFESARGAREFHRWVDREAQRSGIKGVVRKRARIGSDGRIYALGDSTLVTWRSGRAWSGLATRGLTTARTVALARAQQRRIAAALG
jgi:hypothetical protein